MSLAVGSRFPVDVAVNSPRGTVRLAEMLGAGPLVVAFHRLWCPFCQQAARELVAAKDRFDACGARVVLVYREHVDIVRNSCAERAIPFDCLSDSHRELEAATEIKSFSLGRYPAFAPSKLVAALRSGSRVGKIRTGVLQGRGTFVLDSDARIVYAHNSVTAADISPIDDLVAAACSAANTGAGGSSTR